MYSSGGATVRVVATPFAVSTVAETVVRRAQDAGAEHVCVGLGVSQAAHVREIGAYADGAIVGTALVRALRAEGFAAVVSGAGPSVLVLADGPGRRLDAARVAASVSDTPWEPLMLAVDVKGGTVRDHTEGSPV